MTPSVSSHPARDVAVPVASPDLVVKDPTLVALRHVCRHMRPEDQREVYALTESADWEQLASFHWQLHQAGHCPYFKIFSSDEGTAPVALMVVTNQSPGVCGAGFFATERFGEIAHAMTRFIKDSAIPLLRSLGLMRVEVRAMASAPANCRWIEYLGATFEADLPLLGKNGESFKQFAWYGDVPATNNGVRCDVYAA